MATGGRRDRREARMTVRPVARPMRVIEWNVGNWCDNVQRAVGEHGLQGAVSLASSERVLRTPPHPDGGGRWHDFCVIVA